MQTISQTSPACVTMGLKTEQCSVCPYTQYTTIAALGHLWPGNWNGQDTNNHWKNCTRCGSRLQTEKHYDNNGDGFCDACKRDIRSHFIETEPVKITVYWLSEN